MLPPRRGGRRNKKALSQVFLGPARRRSKQNSVLSPRLDIDGYSSHPPRIVRLLQPGWRPWNHAYLKSARGRRNLTVWANCHVTRVDVSGNRASGVSLLHHGMAKTVAGDGDTRGELVLRRGRDRSARRRAKLARPFRCLTEVSLPQAAQPQSANQVVQPPEGRRPVVRLPNRPGGH